MPGHLDTHVVCDDYGTHKHPTVKTRLEPWRAPSKQSDPLRRWTLSRALSGIAALAKVSGESPEARQAAQSDIRAVAGLTPDVQAAADNADALAAGATARYAAWQEENAPASASSTQRASVDLPADSTPLGGRWTPSPYPTSVAAAQPRAIAGNAAPTPARF